jgi:hypothetical protein
VARQETAPNQKKTASARKTTLDCESENFTYFKKLIAETNATM